MQAMPKKLSDLVGADSVTPVISIFGYAELAPVLLTKCIACMCDRRFVRLDHLQTAAQVC